MQCEVEIAVYLALNRILPIICSAEILSEKLNLKLDLRDNLVSLLLGFTLFVFARISGIQKLLVAVVHRDLQDMSKLPREGS